MSAEGVRVKKSKNAFTMIEAVFVIVILGILAAIAIPKLAATRTDAEVSKGRADIASIRSGIVSERQARLITGDPSWITKANMDQNGTGTDPLFGGVMMYPVNNESGRSGQWSGTPKSGTYTYRVGNVDVVFTYDNSTGVFTCDTANGTYGTMCKKLIN